MLATTLFLSYKYNYLPQFLVVLVYTKLVDSPPQTVTLFRTNMEKNSHTKSTTMPENNEVNSKYFEFEKLIRACEKTLSTGLVYAKISSVAKQKNSVYSANHDRRRQANEPIRTRSKYMKPAPSAGKRVQGTYDWFWFYFLLVEIMARDFSANHKTKAIARLLSTLN